MDSPHETILHYFSLTNTLLTSQPFSYKLRQYGVNVLESPRTPDQLNDELKKQLWTEWDFPVDNLEHQTKSLGVAFFHKYGPIDRH